MSVANCRNVDWGLYRYFLAVAGTGSLSAAARALGVSQPTVGRQIQALEEMLQTRLFDRKREGYVLTTLGEAVFELAQGLEETALAIERCVAGQDERLSGRVCISAAEGFATFWLAPKLPELKRRYPEIEIEVNVGAAASDLVRREADIALRIGCPGSNELVGRRIGKVHFGLFAAEAYLARHGVPRCFDDLSNHVIIESVGEIANLAQARRLREIAKAPQVGVLCNNLLTQFAALRAGAGLLAMPLYMAAESCGAQRVLAGEFDLALDLWLLVHRDLRRMGRIGAVFDFLAEEIRNDTEHLTSLPSASR